MMSDPSYAASSYYSVERLEKEMSSGNQMERIREVAKKCVGTVLDVGAGVGKLALELQGKGVDVTALDINESYVEHMKKLGIKKVVLGNAYSLPFPDQSFDTVTVTDGVEHFTNFGQVLNEACRVCRKKIVLTLCQNSRDPPWHVWNIDWTKLHHWLVMDLHRNNEKGEKV